MRVNLPVFWQFSTSSIRIFGILKMKSNIWAFLLTILCFFVVTSSGKSYKKGQIKACNYYVLLFIFRLPALPHLQLQSRRGLWPLGHDDGLWQWNKVYPEWVQVPSRGWDTFLNYLNYSEIKVHKSVCIKNKNWCFARSE